MAIGALQTGYTTLYGKIAGLGTQNGQTRGSNFREHIDGTEKKAPYQHLAQNGTITYKGVTFVCDTDRNRITLGDVTDRSKCLNISLKGGGCLMVNRDNLSDLSQAITMFCPEDINRIMTAIAEDKRAQQMLLEKDEMDDGGQSDATVLQYFGYTDCRARGWKECTRGGGVCLYTYDLFDLDFSGTFHGGRSLIFHL